MKFFLSGELDALVGDDYRPIRNEVEERLNAFFADRAYGCAIRQIAIVPIIMRPEWAAKRPERRLFQRAKAAADYRTQIDFAKFRSGNNQRRQRLVVKNLLDCIADLTRKAGKSFEGQALAEDILGLFEVTRRELDEA